MISVSDDCIFKTTHISYPKGAFNNYVDKKRGRGGQPKVHACPPGGGGVLECPRGPKPRKCFIPFCTVLGSKKEIK